MQIENSNSDVDNAVGPAGDLHVTKTRKAYVNVYMIPVKLTYFFWGCINGTYGIYTIPFFVSVGISKSKAGVITGITFAVASIAGPLWGMLSDYTGRQKLILILICLTSAGTITSLPLVANEFVNTSNDNKSCAHNGTNNNASGIDLSQSCSNIYDHDSNTLFYILLVIVTFGAVFFNPMPGYIEAIALNVIKTSPIKASYGAQRIFGSLGGCASLYLTGFLIDRRPLNGMSTYDIAFYLFVPYALILIPLGCYISRQYENTLLINNAEETKELLHLGKADDNVIEKSDNTKQVSVVTHLLVMFRKSEVIVLMLTALIAGMAFTLFIFFTTMLLDEEVKVSKRNSSFLFIVLAIANTVAFPFAGKIIKLLRGPIPVIILGIFCHCIRHIVMSYTTTYWVMLFIQVLHCFDFALLLSAMMEYIHDISPTEIKVTMTLILRSVKFGVSPFIVTMLGGVIYQKYGGRQLFRWNGILCGIWGVVMIVYYGTKYNRKRRKEIGIVRGDFTSEKCVESGDAAIICDEFGGDTRECLMKTPT